ncbi:MAG: hypothetical protein AB9915_03660 [Candidatus Dojkabacteria bacterium]
MKIAKFAIVMVLLSIMLSACSFGGKYELYRDGTKVAAGDVQDFLNETPVVAATVAPEQTPVVEMTPVVAEPAPAVVVEDDPTYWPQFSCSDLGSCKIAIAPAGGFTIGFTHTPPAGCTWTLFNAGEAISYFGLNEIHSYSGRLPLTSLDGFVQSQKQFVDACR